MSEKNRIGNKVKLIRENRKLSIEDVSERSNLSVKSIESIENGELIPGLTPLIKIARVLGVRLGTFSSPRYCQAFSEVEKSLLLK